MTEHLKTIEQQYQVLSELDHVKKRVGMYAGSPSLETREEFLYDFGSNKMYQSNVSYIPAFIKIISEIIDNSVDEHIRFPKKVNQLKLNINDNEIVIEDNGGIPVQLHQEFNKYVPEIIFGTLRSGSNYSDDEDQSTIGTNGLGCKLANILSEYFIVETADGKNYFHQEFKNGMTERSEPEIKKSKEHFTRITFKPDLEYFKLNSLDDDHVNKILKRLIDVAGCNPKLKVSFNDNQLNVSSFNDYIALYSETFVSDEEPNWHIGLSSSSGFNQTSFVNSVETYMGGSHVNYVVNQITEKLRAYIKKKHKIEVKPADIKSHLHIFISCNINRPKFSSQTKENMVSVFSDYGSTWTCSDKFLTKILTLDVVQSILDWAAAKELALNNAELRKLNKAVDKLNPARVEKFEDANEKKDRSKCTLYLTEGDSAKSAVMSARDPQIHGVFALKGKPLNVTDIDHKKLMENDEFRNILTITGLKLGEQITPMTQLRFGRICILSDNDLDGVHINGLLINMFHTFWPELFELGYMYRFMTPLVKVSVGKDIIEFYDEPSFEKWKSTNNKKFTSKYFKGLGTSTAKDFKGYLANPDNLISYTIEDIHDKQSIELAFSKNIDSANLRKTWLNIEG